MLGVDYKRATSALGAACFSLGWYARRRRRPAVSLARETARFDTQQRWESPEEPPCTVF
jgi:hypothetical protein